MKERVNMCQHVRFWYLWHICKQHMLARGLNFDLNTHTDFSSEARSLNFCLNPSKSILRVCKQQGSGHHCFWSFVCLI